MQYSVYLIACVALFLLTLWSYRAFNAGLSDSSYHQQITRYGLGSVIAILPTVIAEVSLWHPVVILSLLTGASWTVTYPMLYHLTNRRISPDYDHKFDGACGLYLFGILTALSVLSNWLPWGSGVACLLVSLIEYVALIIPLSQIVYYLMYKICIDTDGMKIIQETHINEVIEFIHQMTKPMLALSVTGIVGLIVLCVTINGLTPAAYTLSAEPVWWRVVLELAVLTVILYELLKRRHGCLWNTGIFKLFTNVRTYVRDNEKYRSHREERLGSLQVQALGKPAAKPCTYVLVIGESANRDYMSAFTPQQPDTTPWLTRMSADEEHFCLYRHAYSCAIQTVPALERALTEYNQYNDKHFYDSCSIIDIAHKLGYRVHWYSNQGHLGVAETPVTLVAETADVAKWTKQEVNKVQYDESLLDFLDEVDDTKNNFLVVHLKGSHFNFLNRYPASFTKWGTPGVQDNKLNYINSICYTDSILERIFNYANEHLNLQAMVYFSDHATLPVAHRTPQFVDYGMTHIPLFIYVSDEYRSNHADRVEAMWKNKEKYWTNDLAYELICGLFDVRCAHFDESNSLASNTYKYTREMLTTYENRLKISDDKQQ